MAAQHATTPWTQKRKQCNGTREAYNACVCDMISSWRKKVPTDSLLVLTSSGLAWNQIKFPKYRLVLKFQAFNYVFWLVRAERQSLLNRQNRRKTNTNCSKVVFKQANCQASTQYWRKQVDQVQKVLPTMDTHLCCQKAIAFHINK